MIRGLYTAASGMIAQQRRQDMLTNNLANANTPGYKADQASLRTFPRMLIANLSRAYETSSNELATGVYLQETIPNFLQGNIVETGSNMDVALIDGTLPENSTIMFAVQTENGIRYTRNGNFTVDNEGRLVTRQGMPVLDVNGNQIMLQSENFQILTDGTIFENNVQVAQLNVVLLDNPNQLVKEGNGLFRYEGAAAPGTAVGNPNVTYQVQQGFLERSNVDLQRTMTEMLSAYRTFEANQKVLQTYDQSLDKAVNQVGRIG